MQKRCSCSENSFPPRISGYTGCSSACAPLILFILSVLFWTFLNPSVGFFRDSYFAPAQMRIRGGLPLVPIALFATQKGRHALSSACRPFTVFSARLYPARGRSCAGGPARPAEPGFSGPAPVQADVRPPQNGAARNRAAPYPIGFSRRAICPSGSA